MLELDGLLVPFTENKFRSLNEADKFLYRRLIDSEDQDLFDWFMQKSKSEDAELQRMVEIILDYARNG
ncbi:succinate dehydrogenase assembly factor 2 [Reinekea marina]|uniref:FAD assembly factor SdhE n=1 Tax=Reinekea marina TaxID=1310421 RepID=A0ABV7WWW2_9GAMM